MRQQIKQLKLIFVVLFRFANVYVRMLNALIFGCLCAYVCLNMYVSMKFFEFENLLRFQ
jgi:hypothetical protein